MTSAMVTVQRFNWMGYHGTETEEVNTALLRVDAAAKHDYHDYARRQQVIADIKNRLYLIKRELDLIPEDELRAERERHEQRRAERERQRAEEEAARAAAAAAAEAEAMRQREEAERAAQEAAAAHEAAAREAAEMAARAQREAQLGRADADSDADSEALTEDEERLLERMPRTPAETAAALATFTNGCRVLLVKQGAMYMSYLDGSIHTTLSQLDAHNQHYMDAHDLHPDDVDDIDSHRNYHHEWHLTDKLHAALDAYNAARVRLDAHRARRDAAYATRLRAGERAAAAAAAAASNADGDDEADEATLLSHVAAARTTLEAERTEYNTRARNAYEARMAAFEAAASAAKHATAPPVDAGDDMASAIARAHLQNGPM